MTREEARGLAGLYDARFSEAERRAKAEIWRVLCEEFFQRFVGEQDVVLDLACGFGEFSRFIRAGRKLALDANPSVASRVADDVEFIHGRADDLSMLDADSLDVCFTSNFFEHLPDRDTMDRVLRAVRRVLRPGGRFVAMQPNIRYGGHAYWDYYDHILPFTHRSMREAFLKNGYAIERLIPRFVPWSTKSSYPQHPRLVWLYLKLPPLWRLLGKQLVIVARRPEGADAQVR